MPASIHWLILTALNALVTYGCAAEVCRVMKDNAESARNLATIGETKWVDTYQGSKNESCGAETSPCSSLNYLLYRSQTIPLLLPYNMTIYIASGSLLHEKVSLQNASLVSIIGYGGPEKTEFHCTGNGSLPSVFQIVNSFRIYIANITFTNCGPEESNVFISESAEVVFENCVFR